MQKKRLFKIFLLTLFILIAIYFVGIDLKSMWFWIASVIGAGIVVYYVYYLRFMEDVYTNPMGVFTEKQVKEQKIAEQQQRESKQLVEQKKEEVKTEIQKHVEVKQPEETENLAYDPLKENPNSGGGCG